MEVKKINGNTFCVFAPTNIGIYTFKGKHALVIDTGTGNAFAKRIDVILKEKGLKPRYIINTHHHEDHVGGNKYFKDNYPGVQIYATQYCKLLLQNSMIAGISLYAGNPIKAISNKPLCEYVDFELDEGILKLDDEKFQIIFLKGHSESEIGIITPDKVCFLGDSLFSDTILKKYSFPFLFDIDSTKKSLEIIKKIDAEYFVLGHNNDILSKEQCLSLIQRNLDNLGVYEVQILDMLSTPTTKEDLMQNLIILNELDLNVKQYFLDMYTLSGFLSYLENKGKLKYSLEDGKLYYYTV